MFTLAPQLAADSLFIADLPLCQLRLINDNTYPWYLLIPRRHNISEAYQLNAEDQAQLAQESNWLSQTLAALYSAEKMNVAALGNQVPQLHIHHVVRYIKDIAWPNPVWGRVPMVAYDEETADKHIQKLKSALPKHFSVT